MGGGGGGGGRGGRRQRGDLKNMEGVEEGRKEGKGVRRDIVRFSKKSSHVRTFLHGFNFSCSFHRQLPDRPTATVPLPTFFLLIFNHFPFQKQNFVVFLIHGPKYFYFSFFYIFFCPVMFFFFFNFN